MNWFALVVAAVPGCIAGFFTYRVATKNTKVTAEANAAVAASNAALERQRLDTERARIDAEAYDRARGIYEATLTQLEKQVERLQHQVDKVETLLATERGISSNLRNELFTMRTAMVGLSGTMKTAREYTDDLTPDPE